MSQQGTAPDLAHLVLADEWLQASVLWLVPILGFLGVADAAFLRFGRPAAISAGEWALTHAVFLGPGVAFVAARLGNLARLRRRLVTLPAAVVRVSRPRARAGWTFHVSYAVGGSTFARRFLVQAVDHYRSLAGGPTASLLVDPRHPDRARLLVAVEAPFAV